MKTQRTIFTVESHTMGEPLRLVVGGSPNLKGNTIPEKRDYFIEHYTGEKGKELSSFIYEVCSFFDFDNINGKDFIDIGYDVKVRKRDNYIHIIPPKVRDSGDYTDIFLSDKEKNPVFAYIEYNINSKNKKSYIACININNKSCMIAGVFRSHQKAIDFMKEKFSAA